jgi:hypothetical protein
MSEPLPFEEKDSDTAGSAAFKEDEFSRLRKAKNSLKPEQLTDSEEGAALMPFINECFRYRFADDPDYDKLERLLEKIILKMGDEEYN